MKYIPINDLKEILKFNLKLRKKNTAKFYSWLVVNENTPNWDKTTGYGGTCVFGAILSASESWEDIACIENDLLKIEMNMLKRILNVEKGNQKSFNYDANTW